IAKAGIYDFKIHHEQILVPVILRHWKVADVAGLSAEGEKAREALIKRIDKIGRVAGRLSREPETV
ncbi:MAG: acyl-ACP desaturase, partial [Actinobacteria bacterium]|nr:acyl-ACP desaturase [Actinomycetota bacterium]